MFPKHSTRKYRRLGLPSRAASELPCPWHRLIPATYGRSGVEGGLGESDGRIKGCICSMRLQSGRSQPSWSTRFWSDREHCLAFGFVTSQ